MNALYATLRPAWRASTPLLLAGVASIVMFVLQVVPDVSEAMPVASALLRGSATPAMVAALWAVLIVGPAGLGLILAGNRFGLQHTTLSWHLPAIRHRLLFGTTACAVVVASIAAALAARNAATAGAVVAAFSIALAAFLAPGFVYDVAVPRPVRVLAALPLLAVVVRPGVAVRFAADYPSLVTTVFLALAWLQLHAIASPRTARVRPFRWSAFRGSGSRALYWQHRRTRPIDWRRSLATDRLWPWLHAARYEQYGSGSRYVLWHLWSTTVGVVFARLMEAPLFIAVVASTFLMVNSLQLRMQIAYPMSRVRRAKFAYVASLVHGTWYFFILGLSVLATAIVPLPHLPGAAAESSGAIMWVLAWGCSFAFAPIVQWRAIRQPDADTQRLSGTRLLGFVARGLIYAVLVLLTARQINVFTSTDVGSGRALIVMGLLMVVTQSIHAAIVYAYFTRRDLVQPSEMP